MPLVAHTDLPAFERLRGEGQQILEPGAEPSVPELRVGFLNMMPDAALEATERQFFRLLGACTRIARIRVHPFTVAGIAREDRARAHVEAYYGTFDEVAEAGVDALVVTGANPREADITREPFWPALIEVLDWGRDNAVSVLLSCLATHALLKARHGVERQRCRPGKRWGVFSHRVLDRGHRLVARVNTRFDAPHSHVFEVTPEQVSGAGFRVLAESEAAGVHLAVSDERLRFVCFQGHPEYDTVSLLKEYKRELARYLRGERENYPPEPGHYFPPAAHALAGAHREAVLEARAAGRPAPPFPEERFLPYIDNTWTDTGRALFDAWLGFVLEQAGSCGRGARAGLAAKKESPERLASRAGA